MTTTELEAIVTNIAQRHANHLFREALPHSIKELRSIEISALREAQEVVESAMTGDAQLDLGLKSARAILVNRVLHLELK